MSARKGVAHRRRRPSGPTPEDMGPIKLLQRAHRMMENGEHAGAARIFENLARKAEDRGRLRYAPHFYLQAGRTNILCGQIQPGADLLKHGLALLAKSEQWSVLARSASRVMDELQKLGHPGISVEINNWLSSSLPEPLENYNQLSQPAAAPLPLKCPKCGGALWPGEVEMIDEAAGECPYCGSAIRGK